MIWTKEQLIKNLIRHIVNNDPIVYYVREYVSFYDNIERYHISYKPVKGSTKIRTQFSFTYWMDNFVEYCNDGLMYDIEEYRDQNPDLSDSELEKGIEQLEKEFDERTEDMDQFYDYLNNAITEIHLNPNEEIDA